MHLNLALPGLCHPDFRIPEDFALPALDSLLRHGRFHAAPSSNTGFYARYLWSGSLLQTAKAVCGLPQDTPAVFASPLWQQMGMHHMSSLSGADIGITHEEAAAFCHGLNRLYQDDGLTFYPYRADLWLLALPQAAQWQAPPVLDILGQIDGTTKAEGSGTAQWLALQTECQMWLHQHPDNRRRQSENRPPVNALWLWNDAEGQADGRWVGSNSPWNQAAKRLPAPTTLYDWQTALATREAGFSDGLLLLDDLQAACHTADNHAYLATLENWERHFFAPAAELLRQGRLKTLRLHTDGSRGGTLECRASGRWAFWKPRRRFNGTLD